MLVREGWLYRDGSRGTFVAHPHLGLRIGSFTREVVDHGRVPGARVLSSALVPAGAAAADALGVPPGEKVVEVVRLRTVDGEALAVERTVTSPRAWRLVVARSRRSGGERSCPARARGADPRASTA